MSRAVMKTKYRTLKGFDTKAKAEKYLQSLESDRFSVKEKKWRDRDKRRFYVREIVRKGRKQ